MERLETGEGSRVGILHVESIHKDIYSLKVLNSEFTSKTNIGKWTSGVRVGGGE